MIHLVRGRSALAKRHGGEVEPDPAWIAAYAEGRETFRALYPALRAVRG